MGYLHPNIGMRIVSQEKFSIDGLGAGDEVVPIVSFISRRLEEGKQRRSET